MSDYISRETLIGKVEKHYCAPCKGQGGDLGGDWCRSCVINSVLEKVRGIPAADVVEVVRCRDCKHSYRIDGAKEEYDCAKISAFAKFFPGDHFCGYGERKTDG